MSDRNFCERCGKRISALEWDIHTCTPPAQPQQEQAYKSVNPLGGPAKVFDAMANAIRAGDAYHAVLRQYGFTELQPQQEPVAEVLRGWKLNHAQQESEGNPGMWEVGHLNEDDVFSPVITINTGLYYQDADAEPMARAVLAAITSPPAQKGARCD